MEHMWWDICSLTLHHPRCPDGCSSVQRVSIWARVGDYCMLGDFHLFHQSHCRAQEQISPADTGRRQKNILFPTRSHTYFLCKRWREIKHLGKDLSVNLLNGERPEENHTAATVSHLVLSRSSSGPTRWQLQTDNSISQRSKSQCLPQHCLIFANRKMGIRGPNLSPGCSCHHHPVSE